MVILSLSIYLCNSSLEGGSTGTGSDITCVGATLAVVVPPNPPNKWAMCHAATTGSISWSSPVVTGPNSNNEYCATITGATGTTMTHQTTGYSMPVWPNKPNRCALEQNEWVNFYNNTVIPHELGHNEVNVAWNSGVIPAGGQGKAAYIADIIAMSGFGTGATQAIAIQNAKNQLLASANTMIRNEISPEIKTMHDAYHRDYGATADPNRSIKCP